MQQKKNIDFILGVAIFFASLFILFVWIPLDTESGIVEKVRRSFAIGDSFAPSLAVGILGVGGLMLAVQSRRASGVTGLTLKNLQYVTILLGLLSVSLALMRWAGPTVVALLGPEGTEYRILRDTVPWKFIGFLLGGTFMVSALIILTEKKTTSHALFLGLGVTLFLIAAYDLPFDDLVLPPNGDV